MKIPQELIEQASHKNLIEFCQIKGIELKCQGNSYVIKDNDSLYISTKEPYKWYRHSTNEGGKAIDFCIKYLGMDFRTAVFELTNCVLSEHIQCNENSNQKRVIAYLCKRRCISYEIVVQLLKTGKLIQDIYGNCAFNVQDFNGNHIGYELHGTGDTRFKGKSNSLGDYGFTLQIGADVQNVAYFESCIDLISFYQLYAEAYYKRNIGTVLVSLGGLCPNVLKNYKKHYPNARHVLCVDNDDKGKEFAIRENLKHVIPKDSCKDWNEYLCKKNRL